MRSLLPKLGIRPQEAGPVGWSWLFAFAVFSAYYVIRPIRDEMGVSSGVENLSWLFTGSLVGMIVVNPPFAYIAARLPRVRFVSASYRFFAVNLILFWVALHLVGIDQRVWAGRLFFIWASVFNMFVVSIFWSVMADVYSSDQGQRLFGLIGAAGTIGSIVGSSLTSLLSVQVGAANLLLLSGLLLEVAALSARRLFGVTAPALSASGDGLKVSASGGTGGSAWAGIRSTFTDAYFINLTLHILLFTVVTAILYFQQAVLVDRTFADSATRTRFFANVDLLVNVLTLATQTFATGWFIQVFGIVSALVFLPFVSVLGFSLLGLAPTVPVLMVFQVLRRVSNFAVNRPAREALFTVVSAEDRYKAKSFIDTFVYRVGDQIGAWAYPALVALGATVSGVSAVGVVLAMLSVANAMWLGRRWRQTRQIPPSAPA
jgi:AAA family ATP:ADP antiporter